MASIVVPCLKCDARIKVRAETVGKLVTCPSCGQKVRVPNWEAPSEGPDAAEERPRRKKPKRPQAKKTGASGSRLKLILALAGVGLGGLVLVAAVTVGLVMLIGIASQKVREASAATVKSRGETLKHLAIAMLNYTDTNGGRLPAHAIYSKDGKPLLSWRVTILPYIEHQNLYNLFHLNEPWDSEHNKKLLAEMPKIYGGPDSQAVKNHETYYQVFVGKGTAFEGKEPVRFPAGFLDGTMNTFLIVEASKAVPWTKPEDIPYDSAQPLPQLGLPGAAGFCAALCDGSRFYFEHGKMGPQTLRHAITRNDGEKVDLWRLGRPTDPSKVQTITFK